MKNFLLCFVPFFVAVDAIGVLPIFIGLTEGIDSAQRRRIIFQSLITASAVAIMFLLGGPFVLALVGVGVSDFMLAGGVLLLVISLSDLITGEKLQRIVDPETIGAVPIGVPLISGPAVLTTSVLLANEHGIASASAALLVNIGIAGVAFSFAKPIERFLGNAGSKTLSKVASLFLASIAVMLIRKGIFEILHYTPK
jgi:multiple antibiotic resistance protein